MKKLFFIITLLFSIVSFGQTTNTVKTFNLETSRMVWSDVDEKYLFFDLDKRHYSIFEWTISLNNNNTGFISASHIGRVEDTKYAFNIHNWEIKQNDDGADYLWIDAIQVSDSQKVTLLINKNMYNEQIFSLFMPESNIMLVFDNFNE
jgi:hypothetical protein